jgi:hypothetical protein
VNEVQRPSLVHRRHDRCWISTPECKPPSTEFADLQVLFAVEPAQFLDVDDPAFARDLDVQLSIAETPSLGGELNEALA